MEHDLDEELNENLILGKDKDWKELLEVHINELKQDQKDGFVDSMLLAYNEYMKVSDADTFRSKCDFCGKPTYIHNASKKYLEVQKVSCTACFIKVSNISDNMETIDPSDSK